MLFSHLPCLSPLFWGSLKNLSKVFKELLGLTILKLFESELSKSADLKLYNFRSFCLQPPNSLLEWKVFHFHTVLELAFAPSAETKYLSNILIFSAFLTVLPFPSSNGLKPLLPPVLNKPVFTNQFGILQWMKELLKLHVQLFKIKIFIMSGEGEAFTTTKALYRVLCWWNVQLS